MSNSEKLKSSWRERRQTIKHKWMAPFIFPEWLCERLSYRLGQWALLDILGHAGRLTILVAVIFYFLEADERRMQAENQRKATYYQAWQVINAAQGKTGGGGREVALHDLNKDNVPLVGVDLSKAHLRWLRLYMADLREANLSGANLYKAALTGTHLRKANLSGASIIGSDLTGVDLWKANLSGGDFTSTNFYMANFQDANLQGANLTYTDLSEANLSGADLRKANIQDIRSWQRIKSIELANIYDVEYPPDGFIEWAKEHGAVEIEDEDEWKALLDEKWHKKK